ncbi:MAG: enoyl-CoA hydratase/isomerase family protein [Xanthomonadales bacterium]|nr:enoyl-CoA hydratase/isomerase family protein [Xanthomonadales bacterium]NIN58677.1 enoyl-CoA hydratase/isomerase family protein [Xanthomonadales bacterium]NIN74527.1 enoyl-CoA hydratase/isomerase family protein [Xanthomonadales bacterium]NIO14832.1 enoyl-CoA hydratase/isomerase family protein [Xanthomonadales bacterium]NIP11070.1 enoyl-CoA hydratase/isomerase family protein [Xanthomonadales bacterium]
MADIKVERKGEVEWITLNRPERMNAYDAAMAQELIAAVENASDAGVIVLTGTGRAFCAGGYLANLSDPDPQELRSMFYGSLKVYESLRTSPRPVIAAVNGAAAGGGNELVIACDLAIASENATFGQTGVKVGSAPVLGGNNFLSMSVGEKRAKEIAFLCRRYPAEQALALGLINAVVPPDELEAEVTRWAEELLRMSPRYLEIAKVNSNVWWNQCRDNYLSGLGMLVQAIGSYDMIEGASAFMEKRRPRFEGRAPRED